MLHTIKLPLLTLFRGDGFVLEYETDEVQAPTLYLYSAPGRGEDGELQPLTEQLQIARNDDEKFPVSMRARVGDAILPPGVYQIRVRGLSSKTAMVTTFLSGSVEVVDYDETDRLTCRLAELRIVNERLMGGDHFITRLSLPDGREIYRMDHEALMAMRNRLESEIRRIRRQLEGRSPLTSGGRFEPY